MDTHVMIDIETLDNGPRSAIAQIGAVHFVDGEEKSAFNVYLDIEDAKKYGTVGEGTREWWKQQIKANPELKKVFAGETLHLDAMTNFEQWFLGLPSHKRIKVWGNSPSFDCVILRNAFEVARINTPWPFYNEIDYRTLKKLAGVGKTDPIKREGDFHDGLDDARHQMRVAYHLFEKLGVTW